MSVLLRWFLGAIVASVSCWAQGDPDPFGSGGPEEKIPIEVLKKVARESNVDLVIEVFSAPMVTSASWRREFPKDADFYEKLLRGIETKEVVLEEHLSGTTKGSGEMILQDVREYQYAIEFELAQGVRNPESLKQWEEVFVPARPSSFDTTFLGTWVEVEALIAPQCDLVDLQIEMSRKRVLQPQEWGFGASKHKTAMFGRNDISVDLAVRSGVPTLLGTLTEVGLGERSERVSIAFVTATVEQDEVVRVPDEEFSRGGFRYEVFSMSLEEFAKFGRLKGGIGASYAEILEGLKKGGVKMEKFQLAQGGPSSSMRNAQIVEYIYPTEYNPPGFGPELVLPERKRDRREFPFLSWAFDTKNLGDSLQLESGFSDGRVLEYVLSVEHSSLLRRHSFAQGLAKVEQPEFGLQTIKSSGVLVPSEARLVGTVTPRADPKRVWLAFLTAGKGE